MWVSVSGMTIKFHPKFPGNDWLGTAIICIKIIKQYIEDKK